MFFQIVVIIFKGFFEIEILSNLSGSQNVIFNSSFPETISQFRGVYSEGWKSRSSEIARDSLEKI